MIDWNEVLRHVSHNELLAFAKRKMSRRDFESTCTEARIACRGGVDRARQMAAAALRRRGVFLTQ